MSTLSTRVLLALSLCLTPLALVVEVPTAFADAAPGPATVFFQSKHEAVLKLLKEPAGPAREKKVDAELASLIDYNEMAKVALGTHWDKRTDAERKEFTALLRQLTEKNYKKRLDQTAGYSVKYVSESVCTAKSCPGAMAGDFAVKTETKSLTDSRAAAIVVEYILRKTGTTWTVVDLVTEDSSMTNSRRSDFSKIINKDGWDGLMKKMNKKLLES